MEDTLNSQRNYSMSTLGTPQLQENKLSYGSTGRPTGHPRVETTGRPAGRPEGLKSQICGDLVSTASPSPALWSALWGWGAARVRVP